MRGLSRARRFIRLVGYRLALQTGPARVGYISAQGEGNLGDEVLFHLTRHALSPAKLVPLAFPGQERKLAKLRLSGTPYFRCVVLAGGTLINPFWVQPARTAVDLGIPLWTIGTGVGSCGFPQAEDVDLEEWLPILSHAMQIGVRGPLSADRLIRLGVSGRVEIVGDVALLSARDRALPPSSPRRVLVNLALQDGPSAEDGVVSAERSVADLLAGLVRRGFQPVLIAMHPSDVPRLRLLAISIGRTDLPIHQPSSGAQFLELAEDCLCAITVRLHAGILACCAGVPVLMLGYRDKCLDFMRSMDLQDWCIELRDPSAGARVVPDGLRLVDEAVEMREFVLARALTWKRTLQDYIQRAASFYALRTRTITR